MGKIFKYRGSQYKMFTHSYYVSLDGFVIRKTRERSSADSKHKHKNVTVVRSVKTYASVRVDGVKRTVTCSDLQRSWVQVPVGGKRKTFMVKRLVEGLWPKKSKRVYSDTFSEFDGNPVSPFGDYRRLYPILKRQVEKAFVGSYIPGRELVVEDVLQDSFVRCHQYFHTFDPTRGSTPQASLTTWCARVAFVHARSYLQSNEYRLRDKPQFHLEENVTALNVTEKAIGETDDRLSSFADLDGLLDAVESLQTPVYERDERDRSNIEMIRRVRTEYLVSANRPAARWSLNRRKLPPSELAYIRNNFPDTDFANIESDRGVRICQHIRLRIGYYDLCVTKFGVNLKRRFERLEDALAYRKKIISASRADWTTIEAIGKI